MDYSAAFLGIAAEYHSMGSAHFPGRKITGENRNTWWQSFKNNDRTYLKLELFPEGCSNYRKNYHVKIQNEIDINKYKVFPNYEKKSKGVFSR